MTDPAIFVNGTIQLYHGNFFRLWTKLDPGSVGLVVTSMPYGILESQKWDQEIDLLKLETIFTKILKKDGLVILFCNLKLMRRILDLFTRFQLRAWHVWHKSLAQPVNQVMPLPNAEFILVLKKEGVRTAETTWHPKDGMLRGSSYVKHSKILRSPTRRHIKSEYTRNKDGRRWIGIVLQGPTKCHLPVDERSGHPTQIPESLLRALIRTYSNPGALVVDPFAGSGSTLISAFKENRQGWGSELEKKYFNEASTRIKRAAAQQDQCDLFIQPITQLNQEDLFMEMTT